MTIDSHGVTSHSEVDRNCVHQNSVVIVNIMSSAHILLKLTPMGGQS